MKINSSEWLGWKIVEIEGDFTAQSLLQVRSLFDDLEKSQANRVALDMSKTEFLDSSAIQIMMNYYKRMINRGGQFKIIPSDITLDILRTLCVDDLIQQCISRDKFERTC